METVLVTGGSGLVGHGVQSIAHHFPQFQFIYLSSKDADLTNFDQTYAIFEKYQPNYVLHLAGNVGGLFKNMNYKVEMFEKNILINVNVLRCSHLFKVKKVVSCLSTCIFPDKTTYPINESMLHNGPPHFSNDAYAYSKRMIEVMSRAYREQHGCNFVTVIPTNVYGPYDNYNLEDAHVVPALIHRCRLAKLNGENFVVKGSGRPLRQFVYSDDLAYLMMWVLVNYDDSEPIILSPDERDEVSIGEVARMIAKQYDYEDKLVFDTTAPDGQFKKTADNSKLRKFLPDFQFKNMETGIRESVEWFNVNYDIARK